MALPPSAAGSSQPPLLNLEEIRSAVPPGEDCTQRRQLRQELWVPRKDQPLALVTIHAAKSCWSDRLVLWQRTGDRYRAWKIFDEGSATADVFDYKGRPFLFLSQSQPSAGRSWTAYMLVAITEKGEFVAVGFDPTNSCRATLGPIGDPFDHSYGGTYLFKDNNLRFQWNIWNPDDSPNFPTGGRASGSLSIIEAAAEPSGLKLVVTSCKPEPIQ